MDMTNYLSKRARRGAAAMCHTIKLTIETNLPTWIQSWNDPQQIEADQHCHQQRKWLPYIYNANAVGKKQCTCKHGCHINGLIKSSLDQDDEHINVVADDTDIFAFLWLWYSRLFGKWKTTSVSTMMKWWGIGDVGLGAFGDDGTNISMVTTTRHKSISTLYSSSKQHGKY